MSLEIAQRDEDWQGGAEWGCLLRSFLCLAAFSAEVLALGKVTDYNYKTSKNNVNRHIGVSVVFSIRYCRIKLKYDPVC